MSEIRALIVDDYAPFRDVVQRIIAESQELPALRVICEAEDGLAAVRKTEELQPDLILLDINLPGLNGIEAARRIRQIAPRSKIIFLSEHRSPALIREAMDTGAHGYIIKSDAACELLAAVQAVILDKQFISGRLAGYNLTASTDAKGYHSLHDKPLAVSSLFGLRRNHNASNAAPRPD